MLDDNDIKHESKNNFNQHCATCMSIGRKLMPLGTNLDIYRKVIMDIDFLVSNIAEKLLLCWECHALLKNIRIFQYRAKKAKEMLELGQDFMVPLSNLKTTVQCDVETPSVSMNKKILGNMIKDESNLLDYTEDVFLTNNHQPDNDSIDYNIHENIGTETKDEIKMKNDVTHVKQVMIRKNNVNNKWAKKRAIQNKKPKFTIINAKDVNIDTMFCKLKIDAEELKTTIWGKRVYKSKKYKCECCIVSFKKKDSLKRHITKYHSEDGHFVCDICKRTMSHKYHLLAHIKSHYYKYRCKICDFSCYMKNGRWKHIYNEHRKVFVCLKCGLMFKTRREFFAHYKDWHEKFICDHCGVTFKMRYCIKAHIRKQHSPFECKICEKRFVRYSGLWLHNKTHHSPSSAPAYCVECDIRFKDYYRYRWHLGNSVRHRPRKKQRIPCPDCEKVFSKNIYMKDHYNLVHLKHYKYRCEECNKNFIRNADLKKHNRRVHEGIIPPKNKICNMCGRAFSTNKILVNHIRTHTGERPFACSHCTARFAQAAALAGHIRALHTTTHAFHATTQL